MATEQTNNTAATQHTPAMAGVENEAPKKRNKSFMIVLILLVLVGGSFGLNSYIHGLHHEETDNAQIDANISTVIPRVSGYITEIKVSDNQRVKKGDTLLVLDNRDQVIQVADKQAALTASQSSLGIAQASSSAARSNIGTSKASISAADAQIENAKVNVWRATQDYNRYANLVKDHSITQQQFEQAQATKQSAERQLQVLVDQKRVATEQSASITAQSSATEQQVGIANATIMQRQADLDNAKLNLSYTVITASEDGYVSKVTVQVGQFLQTGQAIFSIVMNQAPWVVANFKETQLDKMKVGQKVTVHVDAYPSHKFEAKVTSFSPATGARFALLPPDNATGNFVKVVQRLPIKIEFTDTNDQLVKELRPGMNVDVDVHLD